MVMPEEKAFYQLKTEEDFEGTPKANVPYISLYKKLAADTTGHGLPHINDARGVCKVSVWILLTLAAIGWMTFHTYVIIYEYALFNVAISLTIETKTKLDFPAVTMCNLNAYRESKLESEITDIFSDSVSRHENFDDKDREEYGEYGFEQTKDSDQLVFEWSAEVIGQMSDAAKRELGHQKEDFIQDIKYDGYKVPLSQLNWFHNWKYGNCFTFNSGRNGSVPIVQSTATGPQWGLKVIFNVQQDEYIPELTEKAGVRVLVHDQERTAFLEEDGIDIPVGFSTAIGIRMKELTRLGGNYGACTKLTNDNSAVNAYESVYPWHNYTLKGCMKTCYQRQLMQNCKCHDYKYLSKGGPLPNDTFEICHSEDSTQGTCSAEIKDKFQNGTLTCDCASPCHETLFTTTISQSTWPNKKQRPHLLHKLSLNNAGASNLIQNDEFDDNFAELEVYYEELNFESMTENPSYEFSQFASDLGGVIGLWVGASVLTCFEYAEFILDVLVLWCAKSRGNRQNSVKTNAFVGNTTQNKNNSAFESSKS